jgi:hypothetical protein
VWRKFRIRADKAARIKQIANKIINPFYGHLRAKQVRQLSKTTQKVKSKFLNQNEVLLQRLENRLDVVVFRLNWAPTILWARRLIWGGFIFVSNMKKTYMWTQMYSSLKKLAFPLKLRDPKSLYCHLLWKPCNGLAKYKFLGEPQKKISYLVQVEDIIQCSGTLFLNQFKTQPTLWHKPIPSHLFVTNEHKKMFYWRFQKYENQSFESWEQPSQRLTSAVVLAAPRFVDLGLKDRIQESFFRWAIL